MGESMSATCCLDPQGWPGSQLGGMETTFENQTARDVSVQGPDVRLGLRSSLELPVGAAVFGSRVGLLRLLVSNDVGASNRNTARQSPLARMLRRTARSPRTGCTRNSGRSRSANVRRKHCVRACGPPRADSERQEDEARSREDRIWSGGLMGTNMPAGNR